jgi:hypothetical protein
MIVVCDSRGRVSVAVRKFNLRPRGLPFGQTRRHGRNEVVAAEGLGEEAVARKRGVVVSFGRIAQKY